MKLKIISYRIKIVNKIRSIWSHDIYYKEMYLTRLSDVQLFEAVHG